MLKLINYGNNCYMNATLQCLTSSNYIINYLNNRDPLHMELQKLIKHKTEKTNKVCSSKNIHDIITEKTKMFKNNNQEDAHEFLIYLMEYLKTDDLYKNTYMYTKKCKKCENTAEITAITNILTFPVKETLKQSIQTYYEREDVESICEKCNCSKHTRKIFLSSHILPKSLFIHFNRFSVTKHGIRKDKSNIEITPILSFGNEKKYRLNSIICHSGNHEGGHYYTISYINKKWFEFNDSHVYQIDNFNIENYFSLCYIILYEYI